MSRQRSGPVGTRKTVKNGNLLRVDTQKRTENEYRQMLRLANLDAKQVKESLKYVELQLA